MFNTVAAKFLEQGVMGLVIVLLLLAVYRLFTLLMKSHDERHEEDKADRKEMLETIKEHSESMDRLTSYIQGVDRIGGGRF